MPCDLERAISIGTTFTDRLASLKLAMLDHLDEPDPPSAEYHMPPGTTHFSTYAEARRTFTTVLSEDFAPRSFMHQMIILDYSTELRWDVGKDMSFLRSLGDGSCTREGYAAAVLARWESWLAVKERWPYHVPDDCSLMSKAQLETVCREMWTAIRGVGMTALVMGRGEPGDAAFSCSPDGYRVRGRRGGGISCREWGLCKLVLRSVGMGVGTGKSIKQD